MWYLMKYKNPIKNETRRKRFYFSCLKKKNQEQIPNVLKNIFLILLFMEIKLFSMCVQLSTFETGKCTQCHLVCRYHPCFFGFVFHQNALFI